MAFVPALAQAEESGKIQYETGGEVPTIPNNESSPNTSGNSGDNAPDESDPDASVSNTPGGAGSGDGGGDSGTGNGAHQGQTNQGSGGGDGQAVNGSKTAGGEQGQAKTIEVTPIEPTSAADDGSSPLVAILIAVAVLAAISVGAFYYRQRRQGEPGSPISPKAS